MSLALAQKSSFISSLWAKLSSTTLQALPTYIHVPTSPSSALEWVSSILWAVPKKKTTHRKKRLRMTTKWLRPMQNITPCPFCGSPTLMHNICRKCYMEARRRAL
ncbi:uncharacterized protein BJ171DRAFT_520517 [Polychytrium aggregatum]|uniref:uncharacterized protein n=1 Tax=Polychytrium aggregatum TaxID=110093 RepID=UPI0022FE342F|nr:uncharacterized protein BJ171DRAFT_520517 [Polychytrium aggregatum]KAI9197295.1 hypothetical protein BJ171DRAFT_520517 [Polychytrium aggregatum]